MRRRAIRLIQDQDGFRGARDLRLGADLRQFQERIVERIHVELLRANRDLDTHDRTEEGDVLDRAVDEIGLLFHGGES